MQPRTEEFLNFLLWSAERLMCPVYRRVDGSSFESWGHKRLRRDLKALQEAKLIEAQETAKGDRLYRLTESGRLHVLGGRDPVARWGRKWDGRWRLVIFDVPTSKNAERVRLRRYLRERGFGCLQKSVWITPDPLDDEKSILRDGAINVQTLVLLEALTCAGESDEQIITGAWDFEEINARYASHLHFLGERPSGELTTRALSEALRAWAQKERQLWLYAASIDPLLPDCLLPKSYRGKQAWEARTQELAAAREQVENFDAETLTGSEVATF